MSDLCFRWSARVMLLLLIAVVPRALGGPVGTPPIILVQPKPQWVWPGTDVTFSVVVSSATPVAYQWHRNGVYLPGETGSTLEIPAVQQADVGRYGVEVRNSAGMVPSRVVDLTVVPETVLVRFGSIWKYRDDGSNQGSAWRESDFDDSLWESGPGELGYGDGDECTVVSYGSSASSKYITTYFRHEFNLDSAEPNTALVLTYRRDDGAVIYLNGKEADRSNMPGDSPIGYQTRAASVVGGAAESELHRVELDPGRLLSGRNVLAVEVHQYQPNSSDISFDLELRVERRPPLGTLDASFAAYEGPDGPVCDLLMQPLGDIVIVGRFSHVGLTPRAGLARLDFYGNLDPVFAANAEADGPILAVEEGSEGELYVGGRFQRIGGQPAHGLAVLHPESGEVLWGNTQVEGTVSGMSVRGTSFYFVGDLAAPGLLPERRLGSFNWRTRELRIWPAEFDGLLRRVWGTSLNVFVAGDFEHVNGEERAGIAAFDVATGALTSWAPVPDGTVWDMVLEREVQYVAGNFNSVGGASHQGVAALRWADGVPMLWDAGVSGEVRAMALTPTLLYLGGEFIGSQGSMNLSAVRRDGGMNDEFDAEVRSNGTILALRLQPDGDLLVGGDFTRMNGADRFHIARIHGEWLAGVPYGRPPILSIRDHTPERFRLRVRGAPWERVVLQRSSDFVEWEGVLTNAAPTGVFDHIDPGRSNIEQRYYRAIIEQ